jgi:cellulase
MDIWEANGRANQLAPHSCNKPGLYRCNGDECGASGVCDKNGCGLNPYRIQKDYYGPKLIVDTTRPFSVVTEFPGKDGVLQSINRKYVQDGKVYSTPSINVTHPMDDKYCNANGATMFEKLGGMKAMGDSLNRGMVLAMSIWWDEGGFMNWLDSGDAGPCNATEGDPKVVQTIEKNPTVIFSQIKWGEIGSTYKGRPANRWARDE